MRKADYLALAATIAHTRTEARRAVEHGDAQTAFVASVRMGAAEDIARDFARAASVDKQAFLQACGIEPDTVRPPGKLFSAAEAKAIVHGAGRM